MKKKIISFVLCVLLCIGICTPISAAELSTETAVTTETTVETVDTLATETDGTLQESSENVGASLNATDITLYGLTSAYAEKLTIPSSLKQSFQIVVNNAGNVSYVVSSGSNITVSNTGLVEINYTTWYYYDGYGTTQPPSEGQTPNRIEKDFRTGDAVITVTADGQTYKVNVHVVDYANYYADQVIEDYIAENITSDLTDMELMKKIAAFPANYNYSASYSGSTAMIVFGGGDCWASTSAIIKICDKLGIEAWVRNGNKDAGAGSGHRNAVVSYNGKYYELEAGYVGTAPRAYSVIERDSLFCYRSSDSGVTVYQYDGHDTSPKTLVIPETLREKNVIAIEDNFAVGSLRANFTSIQLPDTVTSIGKFAFASFEKVTTINIPASVTEIETGAFAQCSSLKNFNCAADNPYFSSADGVLYDKNKQTVVSAPGVETITLPDTVSSMEEGAFSYNFNLKKVILPENMTAISDNVFFYCDFLEKIYIPKSVTSIGENAFYRCDDMTIYGVAGSYAQNYAEENDINFVECTSGTDPVIDLEPTTDPDPVPDPDPTTDPDPIPDPTPVETPKVTVSYRTHVQSFGWQGYVTNGTISGTSGKAKRLEAINISVNGNTNLGIRYTTHCQSYGWLPWSANGEMNGTEGEAKRLEAIKIELIGADKDKYDVYYRVHAQSYGWLGWAKNGAPAGTAGYAKRLEAIQIVVVKKGESFNTNMGNITSVKSEAYVAKSGTSPVVCAAATSALNPVIPGTEATNVSYRTHVQSYGWQGWKYNGQMSGTSGEAKRLEGINIKLTNKQYDGSIVYTTHVQKYGWQGDVNDSSTWKKEGEMAGTSGEAKRLEAICIKLTGEMEKHYDVYYRVHAQSYGWLGWAKNGECAGTAGYAKRLEGIQVVLVPKGGSAPASNYGGVNANRTEAYIAK